MNFKKCSYSVFRIRRITHFTGQMDFFRPDGVDRARHRREEPALECLLWQE